MAGLLLIVGLLLIQLGASGEISKRFRADKK